ncbi:hypothetical protein QZH41_003802 [Actinostola sp. cb2023]|nr:hypothetical protein QZH41_003802 [Actinostola sp. cb2023]
MDDKKTMSVKEEPMDIDMEDSDPSEDKLIFIQLPDKLPISLAFQDKTGINGENNEKAKSTETANLSLKDVSEGYIGKLQVLKSGKTRLLLGDVTLDVAMGTSCSFLQDSNSWPVSIHFVDLAVGYSGKGNVLEPS